jgi:cAMP-dependent protein kinase regulator
VSGQNLLAEVERAVLREPENLGLRVQLARALRQVGRLGDALAELRFCAIRFQRAGQVLEAVEVCREVLEIDPTHDEVRAMFDQLSTAVPPPPPKRLPPPPPPARQKTVPPGLPLVPPESELTPSPGRPATIPRDRLPPARAAAASARPLASAAEPSVTAPPIRRPASFSDFAPQRNPTVEGPTPLPAPVSPTQPHEEPWQRHPLAALEEDIATDPGAEDAALLQPGAFGLASLLDEDQPLFPNGSRETVAGTAEARRKGPVTRQAAVVPPPPPATAETPVGELAMARAFDEGFDETLSALGPDGSTIEESLGVFRELPPDALHELSRRMTARRYQAGEVILREGDPGHACFVVNQGAVSVRKRDPNAIAPDAVGSIEVIRLGHGVLFGEFALLHDSRRHATVVAVEPTEVFEIPRALLAELTQRFPEVGPALERLYRERLLSNLLTTAPFFQPLPLEDRGPLMARFQSLRIEAGETVVKQGERTGGFYLVMLGSVTISKRIAKHQRPLVTLREGAYFGEMSLLRGTTASATVTAEGATELAVLSPQDFYAVMAATPVLWEELRREAKRREQITRHITGSGEQHWV